MKYIFFTDQNGVDRLFHARPPHFMASVIGYYQIPDQANVASKSFDMGEQNFVIHLDEAYQSALDSKYKFIMNKAIHFYKKFKTESDGNDSK